MFRVLERPNVDLLSGSEIMIDQGIDVNRYTACNTPDTYAECDVAVTFDPVTGERVVTGLWTNAVEMGRCAGYNMTGRIFLAESYRLRIS